MVNKSKEELEQRTLQDKNLDDGRNSVADDSDSSLRRSSSLEERENASNADPQEKPRKSRDSSGKERRKSAGSKLLTKNSARTKRAADGKRSKTPSSDH